MLKNITIRSKFMLFNIIIIGFTLYTLGYISNRVYSERMLDRAIEASNDEMLLIDNNIDNLINTIESQARLLSISENIQIEMALHRDLEGKRLDIISNSVRRAYFDIIISNPVSLTASLLTTDNRVLYIGDVENDDVRDIIDPRIIELSRVGIKPVMTGPFNVSMVNDERRDVFVAVKSIIERDTGYYLGSVFTYLDESLIAETYMNDRQSKSFLHIVDENDVIVSSVNKDEIYKAYSTIAKGAISDVVDKDQNSIVTIDGITYLQNIHYYEKMRWRIINLVPLSDITVEITDVTRIIISVGIICLVLGFLFSIIMSKSITKPISVLATSMRKVRGGILNERISESRINQSEIGQLSNDFNKLMDDMESLVKDVKIEQEKRKDYELQLVQSQIKPHFLYNTIETIISCIKLDYKDRALDVAKGLANFYRGSLSKGNDIISIREEVDITKNYLLIQGFRYAEYMTYEIDVDEEINVYQIQKLMLQPIVENAIYHGIKPQEEKGCLSIRGYCESNEIVFKIKDSGVGMDEEMIRNILSEDKTSHDGFGLGSMNNRIQLLYGEGYGISIESRVGEYTEVTLRIPKIEHKLI